MKYTNFKLNFRTFATVLSIFISCSLVMAQQITVRGVVKDAASGEPILGANIIEKGTTNGTITNLDGEFSLNANSKATLVVKYVGYEPQEIAVAGKTNLTILLKEDAIAISEVMVIGYGTVKKNDATGSLTAIKPEKLNKGMTPNAQDMIVGKIAGVNVTNGGGTPGGGATIRIRGGSSLNASNDPLIVIDGLPMDNYGIKGVANPLSTINPADIESFTVLKDASATAIYGSRASNGVIIITTKKGEKGSKPKVSYEGSFSVSSVANTKDVLTGDEFRTLVGQLFPGNPNDVTINKNDSITRSLLGSSNTDWQKEIYRTALSNEHNVTITGGLKNMPYRATIGYTNQQGVIKTSNFERYLGSINLSPSLFDDHLKININAKGMLVNNRYADLGVVNAAASMDPTQPVMSTDSIHINRFGGYWEWYQLKDNGSFLSANNLATRNPIATLNQKEDQSTSKSFIGSFEADYKFHFLPQMRVHLNLGIDRSYGMQTLNISTSAAGNYPYGRIGWIDENKSNKILTFWTQYSQEIQQSKFDVMAGYEWQHFYRDGQSEYRSVNKIDSNGDGTIDANDVYYDHITPAKTRWATESYLVSLFGRANYNYADKYLLTATLRRDGSSRFSSRNNLRWGLFPAFAFAWKIIEEPFMKDINEVSELKLRLGYGVTGQQELNRGDYPYIPVYTTSVNGAYYQFGNEYVLTSRPDAYNPNLKWEETTTYNAGLDMGFLKDRITVNIDYYHRITSDLINVVQVPAGTNFKNKVISNVGTLENNGIELSLNLRPIVKKDFSWDITYNLAFNRNKITKLTTGSGDGYYLTSGGTFQGAVQVHTVGQSSNTFWVYKQLYDANGKIIEEGAPNPVGGNYKATDAFMDMNEDGVINDKDKYYYHNAFPDASMGLSNKIIYKNFDFGFNFHANIGNYVFNAVKSGGSNLGANGVYSLGYFTNKPRSAFETNFIGTSTNTFMSDYFIENGSFLRCDNITFGYSFRKLFKVINSGRISATVQNPFILTNYSGLDPEVFGGIDDSIYPRPVMTVLGLSLNF